MTEDRRSVTETRLAKECVPEVLLLATGNNQMLYRRSQLVLIYLKESYLSNPNNFSGSPYAASLFNKAAYQTLSKALEMSRATALDSPCFSIVDVQTKVS
ncbi:hypothetical protein HHI36_009821 [Cryptolaemus montrouzieri]|uniref:Uncharacterized protein n=1 Tax=Cryptolaemus montrouzieri TaxID=559131 RepID=A0ABD2MHC3_9CUCU